MTNYQYVIIGGGMTAAAAVDGIREVDSAGEIGLISAELDAPYDRPALSKALWKGTPWRASAQDGEQGVTLHLGRIVKEIAPEQKRVVDDKGRRVHLIKPSCSATGGRPRRLAFGDDQIMYFDPVRCSASSRAHPNGSAVCCDRWRIYRFGDCCGAGFNGKEVVMIFPGKDTGDRVFPRPLAQLCPTSTRKKV